MSTSKQILDLERVREWYHSIDDHPGCEIRVKAEHVPVTARTAMAEEMPQLWNIMTDDSSNYDTYQSRTDRDIPSVVLSRRG